MDNTGQSSQQRIDSPDPAAVGSAVRRACDLARHAAAASRLSVDQAAEVAAGSARAVGDALDNLSQKVGAISADIRKETYEIANRVSGAPYGADETVEAAADKARALARRAGEAAQKALELSQSAGAEDGGRQEGESEKGAGKVCNDLDQASGSADEAAAQALRAAGKAEEALEAIEAVLDEDLRVVNRAVDFGLRDTPVGSIVSLCPAGGAGGEKGPPDAEKMERTIKALKEAAEAADKALAGARQVIAEQEKTLAAALGNFQGKGTGPVYPAGAKTVEIARHALGAALDFTRKASSHIDKAKEETDRCFSRAGTLPDTVEEEANKTVVILVDEIRASAGRFQSLTAQTSQMVSGALQCLWKGVEEMEGGNPVEAGRGRSLSGPEADRGAEEPRTGSQSGAKGNDESYEPKDGPVDDSRTAADKAVAMAGETEQSARKVVDSAAAGIRGASGRMGGSGDQVRVEIENCQERAEETRSVVDKALLTVNHSTLCAVSAVGEIAMESKQRTDGRGDRLVAKAQQATAAAQTEITKAHLSALHAGQLAREARTTWNAAER